MTSSAILPDSPGSVLVASANAELRDRVLQNMERHAPVQTASGGAEALAKLESGKWRTLFVDRRLPDLDAEELVETIERNYPGIRVVMVDSDISGAASEELRGAGSCAPTAKAANAAMKQNSAPLPGMIGDSEAMQEVYRRVRLVAPRNTTVLINGPTGSGKELVATAIHQLSGRAGNHLVVVNCAAIPEALVESELFGYARGAFTGALQTYAGKILSAQGGTLFLDEIGELPLSAQAKLLRFVENKEVQRLGSTETVRVEVRLIAATNRDLATRVARREFREDLFFRLSAFPIELPRLSERGDDLMRIAGHFLQQLSSGAPLRVDAAAERILREHSWPGNVRELQQVLERAVILAGERSLILPEHLQFSVNRKLGRRVA